MKPAPAMKALGILLALSLLPQGGRAQAAITYFQTGEIYEYRVALLDLVLEKTRESHGAMKAIPYGEAVTQARGLQLLRSGSIDIASLGTSREREEAFLPVRIDILRGLLGYRVLMIKEERQGDFDRVRNLEDLRGFSAGFGSQWADISVLRDNGLPVEGVANTLRLPEMLSGGRIDYLPRGINEAWIELAAYKPRHPDLAIENGIALFYPYPVYFFVRKDNVRLAERLKRGLELALEDGSFRKLFLDYHKNLIAQAGLGKRILIRLENDDLPEGCPPVDPSWWLK